MKRNIFVMMIFVWQSFFAFSQNTPTCPLSLSDIEVVFGTGFRPENPSKIGDILSCRFTNGKFTIQISTQPAYNMRIDDYHRQMSPKNVTWRAIPNDPDGAKIEIREDGQDDLSTTPAIAYIRKNKYVHVQILGNYYNFDERSRIPQIREEMRNKLAKLKRVP